MKRTNRKVQSKAKIPETIPENRRLHYLISLLMVVLTLAVYSPIVRAGFIHCDDEVYILNNTHLQAGLTLPNIHWAMTSFYASNWHPLTWMSHMLDWRLFGLQPLGYHLVNVLFHLANILLLFYLLRWMTGLTWRSAAVALLFAIHPLHVESVAWVAERKDVLSTFFWLLTLLAYVGYVKKPSVGRYLLAIAAFVLGLMAKPMLVSLPVTLLLLDIWPLGRFAAPGGKGGWRLIWEKAPFAVLAAGSCVVTYLAQSTGGSVAELSFFSMGVRAANALVAYVSYITKMLNASNLAMLYRHPEASLPTWQVVGSAFFLICVSALAVQPRRKRPYILVGWLWYLITLIPVIGLVQVGLQAMADRYTYVPLTGLFIIIAWGVPDLLGLIFKPSGNNHRATVALGVAAGIIAAALAGITYVQVGYWENDITLFEHSVAVDKDNYMARNNLGGAFKELGRKQEAIAQYREAIRIRPDYVYPQVNLGPLLVQTGAFAEAIPCLVNAVKVMPGDPRLNNDLGVAYGQQGNMNEAAIYFAKAVELDPHNPDYQTNLATAQGARRKT